MFKKIGRGLKKFFTHRITQAVVMQAAAIAVPHVAAFIQTGWQKKAVVSALDAIDFQRMDEYSDLGDPDIAKAAAREAIVSLLVQQGIKESVGRIAVEIALAQVREGNIR